MAKRLITLTSLTMIFFLFAVPALAQEVTPSETATDQYGPGGSGIDMAEDAAINAVEGLIGREGADVNGAEAYAAALNAAQDTGVDTETAEIVAARAVAATDELETSGEPETPDEPETSDEPKASEEPKITELPDTGGVPLFLVCGGVLAGVGLLARAVLR